MDAFEVLTQRGFVAQHTAGAPDLLKGERAVFYVGFDPTGDSLHVGHTIPIMAMAHLQRAGHFPIAVVGGGTAMVGDPSGKDEMRQMLTDEQVARNKEALRSQLSLLLDLSPGKGMMVDNSDWLLGLGYISFLRDIGRHFSVNAMLGKASVKMRLEKGLSFIEFNYQILQAYDFLELFRRHQCNLQLGGDDQWGNITAGIDLVRRVEGKEVHAITMPLITTSTGKKMGKSAQGAVWLDADKLSPYEFFQYWVNVDDADVGRFLRMFTFLPISRIEELEALQGADVRQAKQVLALEVTALVHGKTEAQRALSGARAAFEGGGAVAAMPQHAVQFPVPIVDALAESGLCRSKSDARRQIKGGAVRLGQARDTKVSNPEFQLTADLVDGSGGVVLWRGKKSAVRLVADGAADS